MPINFLIIISICIFSWTIQAATDVDGKRPYELEWSGRDQDTIAPIVDFENLDGWKSQNHNSQTTFGVTNEKKLWGAHVARLAYQCTGANPVIELLPPEPVRLEQPFDAVSMWVYGNNFLGDDKSTPPVKIILMFKDSKGIPLDIEICSEIRWKEWFLCHRRLTPPEAARVDSGGEFIGIRILNGYNRKTRVLYFDNLAAYKEKFRELQFDPRPRRGVQIFSNKPQGVNTGDGKLPFPNRSETIAPDSGSPGAQVKCGLDGLKAQFEYIGDDGTLTAELDLEKGVIAGLKMKWGRDGEWITPAVEGGIFFDKNGKAVRPYKIKLTELSSADNRVYAKFDISVDGQKVKAAASYRLYGKSFVADLQCTGGKAVEFRFGQASGFNAPRLIEIPYYVYGKKTRPAVVASGTGKAPLFFAAHLDWTLSNASRLWSENAVSGSVAKCNGGAAYLPKTDGRRNDLYERIVFSLSPKFTDVLPHIPNPPSEWREATADKLWLSYASGVREHNMALFRYLHRLGIRELIVTDHEKQWRESHEGYTFRTRFAPDKGGNEGQYRYTRFMCDELGYLYGPYNNFTDIVPTNEYWNYDMVARDENNQLLHGFVRCYSPKPVRAVEFGAVIPAKIQQEMHFKTGYCDVHTAIPPWRRTDYDARVPGAGTFAGTYYAYGEVLLLQKKAWEGPVSSEGGHHYIYSGLTDGNYAQDQSYFIPQELPWLVDFDLLKIHPLENNFGMGSIWMFFGRDKLPESEAAFTEAIDRFLAATAVFGHSGLLLLDRGYRYTLRSYYMLQQLQSCYNRSTVDEICYTDPAGCLYPTSKALVNNCYQRSQVVVKYRNGCVVAANGNKTQWMQTTVDGRPVNLPPNGYMAWTADGKLLVYSKNHRGHRIDYAETPEYIFIDGRGRFARLPKAASAGSAVCRILKDGWEIIPYDNHDCGFAVDASRAEALDKAGNIIGPARLRRARGLTYAVPVAGAFSYRLYRSAKPDRNELSADILEVFPGQRLDIDGCRVVVPEDCPDGSHWWSRVNGKWIDFDIKAICNMKTVIRDQRLVCDIDLNITPENHDITVSALGQTIPYAGGNSRRFQVEFILPQVEKETFLEFTVTLKAGNFIFSKELSAAAVLAGGVIAELPARYRERGVFLPDGTFDGDLKKYRATAHPARRECGGSARPGLSLRPPLQAAAGFTGTVLDEIKLPKEVPNLFFTAEIGRYDKCPTDDETIFRVMVRSEETDKNIGQWNLKEKCWKKIRCDLTPWAGKRIQLVLLVGSDRKKAGSDNTFGCWTDMKVVTDRDFLHWKLSAGNPQYRLSPAPPADTAPQLLRQAVKARLHYEGQQFENCELELNGIALGQNRPAMGDVRMNSWKTGAMELPEAAIRKLKRSNRLVIHNPQRVFFKIRNCSLELEMKDGKCYSSLISADCFTQPGRWRFIEGTGVPFRSNVDSISGFNDCPYKQGFHLNQA